jgi:hypothetical protein
VIQGKPDLAKEQLQTINFEKNLAIAGGFLILAVFGPGLWFLDGRRAPPRARGSPPEWADLGLSPSRSRCKLDINQSTIAKDGVKGLA